MNTLMVKRLIYKDWYLQRWPIASCIGGGLVSVALLAAGQQVASYIGFVLLISVLIIIGVHLAMATVLIERKEQTLAFVMSLPISAREYTTAKILGNLSMFLIPWVTLVGSSIIAILSRDALPDGAIPVTILILGEILVSTSIVLGVALVSESQGWTMGALIAGNLFCNFFIFALFRIPSIAQASKGPAIVWDSTVLALLGAEILAFVLVLALTVILQERKTDFI